MQDSSNDTQESLIQKLHAIGKEDPSTPFPQKLETLKTTLQDIEHFMEQESQSSPTPQGDDRLFSAVSQACKNINPASQAPIQADALTINTITRSIEKIYKGTDIDQHDRPHLNLVPTPVGGPTR